MIIHANFDLDSNNPAITTVTVAMIFKVIIQLLFENTLLYLKGFIVMIKRSIVNKNKSNV